MEAIEKILTFIVEIEKLKAVERKTRPVGLNRYENSAEHSWHVCLSALMLKEQQFPDGAVWPSKSLNFASQSVWSQKKQPWQQHEVEKSP